MKIIKGDLLKAKEQYIAQQNNCLTVNAKGLADIISRKWPWADAYTWKTPIGNRNVAIEEHRDEPGTIKVCSSPSNDRHVICMFAQWAPGKPQKYKSYPDYKRETYKKREEWFRQCLDEIGKLDIDSVAFPYKIGCGMAGGKWENYRKMLEEFEKKYEIDVVIYSIE